MCCSKTISNTALRFYDFVRQIIVISFQIMFSNAAHNDIRIIKYVLASNRTLANNCSATT